MLREDYELFLEKAPEHLPEYYFLQTFYSDPEYYHCFAKLRDSRTTFIENTAQKLRHMNQGIFIDIFVLDNLPDDLTEREAFVQKMEKTRLSFKKYAWYSTRYKPKTGVKGILRAALHQILGNRKNPVYRKYDRDAQKYRNVKTKECGMVTLKPLVKEYRYENAWIEETAELPFSFTTIPVPADYRSFLNREYGSGWETPVHTSSLHGDTIFDTDKPYTEYI
jgi:lipopolysaccharide cholinephosphotransferase